MAVEDIIQVKSVEWFEGNKGKYPKYTYTGQKGESTKAVFDTELQKVLSEALENHLACSITLDKKDKYWNITTAKLVVDQIDAKPPIKKESGGVKQQDGMTPDKWDEKDRITRLSIERQVSAKLAFEYANVYEMTKKREITIDDVLLNAEVIYQWISQDPASKPPERVSSPPKQEASSNPPEQEDGYSKQIDKVLGGRDLSLLKSTTDVMRAITGETNGSLQPTDQLNLLREVDPAFKWTGYKGTMPDLYQKILLLAEGELK